MFTFCVSVHDDHIILHRFLYNLHNRAFCKVNSQEQNKVLSTMTAVLTHTGSPTVSCLCFCQSKFPENNKALSASLSQHTGMLTASHPIKTSSAIFPAKTLKQPPIYLDNHSNRVQDWLVLSRTFKRWNGAWSLMKRHQPELCVFTDEETSAAIKQNYSESRIKSLHTPPVNTLPYSAPTESF